MQLSLSENIKIFNNAEFGEIRVMLIDDDPWFVGKDIAVALGYAKPENALSAHVDEQDKTTTLIQVMVLITRARQPSSMNPAYTV